MKRSFSAVGMLALTSAVLLLAVGGQRARSNEATQPALKQVASFPLVGVKGRLDHMAFDSQNHRLFIAALANDTVEVIDTTTGKRIKSITGETEPQGIQYLPNENILVVANGGKGTIDFFDGTSLDRIKRVSGYPDADNVRYDKATKQIIVASNGRLTWFTPAGAVQANTKLPGHPEAFQLDQLTGKVFVDVPSVDSVFTVDRKTANVAGQWKLKNASANYALCLDSTGTKVFVACRNPAQIIEFDAQTGSEISRVQTSGDADDLFYDQVSNRLYESCGAGSIDVFAIGEKGRLLPVDHVATAAGARTSLLVAESRTLFLAVPKTSNQSCEIRIFKVPQ